MSLFFAPAVFPACVPSPKEALVVRALEAEDADSAEFFMETLPHQAMNPTLLTQLQAAVSIRHDDARSAYEVVANALPSVHSPQDRGKLAFQAAVLADELKMPEIALAHVETALDIDSDQVLFHQLHATLAWRCHGSRRGREYFAVLCYLLGQPQSVGIGVWADWARLERANGNNAYALTLMQDALKIYPGNPDLVNIAAACHLALQEYTNALNALDSLGTEHAKHPVVLCNCGGAYYNLGQYEDAIAAYTEATEVAPNMFEAFAGLARVYSTLNDDAEVINAAGRAYELAPADERNVIMLVSALSRQRREAEALICLKTAVQHNPDSATLCYTLATAHHKAGKYAEAEAAVLKAVELAPGERVYHGLLGLLYSQYGAVKESQKHLDIALSDTKKQAPINHSNKLFTLHYDTSLSSQEIFEEHYAFGKRFSGTEEDETILLQNVPDPDRKLRVAYISSDFRSHSVAFFMMAIVDRHNRDQVEVFVYNGARRFDAVGKGKPDATMSWFKEVADHWREVYGQSFDTVREMLAEDKIDILVDLAGHTAGNHMPLFGRRVAPVQVTYLGYPNTTGMLTMDYRLVDNITDPPGEADQLATEKLLRLPNSLWCYRPILGIPEVEDGPLSRGLPMTYGSFNNCMKLNDLVFDAWAEILHQVPSSRLLLKSQYYSNPKVSNWVLDAFHARGIEKERIDTRAFTSTLSQHLDLYDQMDVALDTFPYNGTTTTCEAISMGVPVLTLKGDRHSARVGESLMTTLGLQNVFLAENPTEYVRRAVKFAQEREGLAALRKTLRPRMFASPLCDEDRFVANLEAAYRQMWKEWCADGTRRYGLKPSPFDQESRQPCEKT